MNAQTAAQPATPKQIAFATKLASERTDVIVMGCAAAAGLPYEMPDFASITKGQASAFIEAAMNTPKAKKSNAGAKSGLKLTGAGTVHNGVQTTFYEDPGNAAEAAMVADEIAAEQAAVAKTSAGPVTFSTAELKAILSMATVAQAEVDLSDVEKAVIAKIAAVIA